MAKREASKDKNNERHADMPSIRYIDGVNIILESDPVPDYILDEWAIFVETHGGDGKKLETEYVQLLDLTEPDPAIRVKIISACAKLNDALQARNAAAQTADTPEQKDPAEAVAEFFDKATPAFERMKRLISEADATRDMRERLITNPSPGDIPADVLERHKLRQSLISKLFDEIGSKLDVLVKAAVELMDDDTKIALLGQAHALHIKFAELQEQHKFFEDLHIRQRGVIEHLKGDLETSRAARKKLVVELEDTKERQQCAEKELALTQRDLTAAYEDMKILREENARLTKVLDKLLG